MRYEPALDNNGVIADFPNNYTTDSLKFKVKLIDQTGNNGTKRVWIIVLSKYTTSFWRTPEMLLRKCEINLILNWYKKCLISFNALAGKEITFTNN